MERLLNMRVICVEVRALLLNIPIMYLGVSHLCVYINNGVIENTIIGDTMASLLQVVAVSGKPGDIMEKTYETPNFCKLITKELSEVTIEIRSLEGRPIPFIGVVIVTLVFKRLTIF